MSTEPGVISATAAAAAASTVTNMETTTHELTTKEVILKLSIKFSLCDEIYNIAIFRLLQ